MNAETKRVLLNSLSAIGAQDWGSPEKNNRAAQLVKQIREAAAKDDEPALSQLAKEVQRFRAASFLLFERMKQITAREEARPWKSEEDSRIWKGFIARAKVVDQSQDGKELIELASRMVSFLERRNGHDLAARLKEGIRAAGKKI